MWSWGGGTLIAISIVKDSLHYKKNEAGKPHLTWKPHLSLLTWRKWDLQCKTAAFLLSYLYTCE